MRPKSEYYSLKSHKLWKTYIFTCNQKQVLCDAVPEYVSKVFTSPLSSICPQFFPLKTDLINQKQIFNFLYYLLLSSTFTNLSTGCVLLCAFKHNGERGLVDLCCCCIDVIVVVCLPCGHISLYSPPEPHQSSILLLFSLVQ